MEFLATGCEKLDILLGGGIPLGLITLFYGEASTGKTALALRMAVEVGRKGFTVIYVDSDSSLLPSRVASIFKGLNVEELEDLGILVFRPWDFNEQRTLVEDLETYLKGGNKLVVIDSVTNLYRLALTEGEAFKLNKELGRHLAFLAELAARRGLAVLCTAQVHSKPDIGVVEPVAKRVLTYWAGAIMRLELKGANAREVRVERFPVKEVEDRSIQLRFGSDGQLC